MIHYQAGVTMDPNGGLGEASSDKDARRDAGRMFIKFRQPLGLRLLDKKRGVPADGEYLIRFCAKAVRRKSRYKDSDLRYNSDQPMRLSISIDSRDLGATAHRIIGEYEIPDNEWIEVEHRVWLEKGFTFHLHWANGPNGSFKRIMQGAAQIQQGRALSRPQPSRDVRRLGTRASRSFLRYQGTVLRPMAHAGVRPLFSGPSRKPESRLP